MPRQQVSHWIPLTTRGYAIEVSKVADAAEVIEKKLGKKQCNLKLIPDVTGSMAMVQLDGNGRIVRVNQALVRESGVAVESLIGRTLTGLSMDPDPRIAGKLMHKLLKGGAAVTTARPASSN